MTDEKRKELESAARQFIDERRQRLGLKADVPKEVRDKAIHDMAKALEQLERGARAG